MSRTFALSDRCHNILDLFRVSHRSAATSRRNWTSRFSSAEVLESRRLLTLLWKESFEAAAPNYDSGGSGVTITPSVTFNDGLNDHFQRTNGSDISNISAPYSGQEGSFFWAAEDVDDNGGNGIPTQTIEFTGINIAGYTDIEFSGLFAADGDTSGVTPGGNVFDGGEDFVAIDAQVDGGPYIELISFASDSFRPNGALRIDTNGDLVGDGVALDSVFQEFSAAVALDGSTLSIRVSVSMDSSHEEVAFDNFQIKGVTTAVNGPPTVDHVFAPNVGETEIGDTSYSFQITYDDTSAVDVLGTIDTGDVSISGPGGTLTVTAASPSVQSNGSPRIITYSATPPGGSWDVSDNGMYTISINANEVGDDGSPQLFAAASAVATFDVDVTNTLPVVAGTHAEDIIVSDFGDTTYSFTVTYTDIVGVDTSSIDGNDFTITSPSGVTAPTNLTGVTADADGTSVTATYSFVPPGGSWDETDFGTYIIGLVGGQVLDVNGAAVDSDMSVATFSVRPTVLLLESFETDGQGSRYLASQPFSYRAEGVAAIWNRSDGILHQNVSQPYFGHQGQYYWAAENVDHSDQGGNGAAEQQLDITGIDISEFTGLTFSGLFAADGDSSGSTPGGTRFDSTDYIRVQIQIDDNGFQDIIRFEASEESLDGAQALLLDTDFDGVGDGTPLDSGFQQFSASGISDGDILDLRILVHMDGNGEEIAFDQLVLSGATVNQDFGDAPDSYGTTLAVDGARHGAVGPMLGTLRDAEVDGQPSSDAGDGGTTGDDGDGMDDEDGVVLTSNLIQGETVTFDVTASAAGFLNAWIDANQDGDFLDLGEHFLVNEAVTAGVNNLDYDVPAEVLPGETFVRFRLTSESVGSPSPVGLLPDGEVEDYAVDVLPGAPTITTPNDQTFSDNQFGLDWDVVPGAEGYEVWYTYATTGAAPFIQQTVMTNSFTPSEFRTSDWSVFHLGASEAG